VGVKNDMGLTITQKLSFAYIKNLIHIMNILFWSCDEILFKQIYKQKNYKKNTKFK